MDPTFVMIATGICIVVGLGLLFLPVRRYFGQIEITLSGVLFVFAGVILITTFKWTDIAMKIGDWELKIAQQQQAITTMTAALQSADTLLADAQEFQINVGSVSEAISGNGPTTAQAEGPVHMDMPSSTQEAGASIDTTTTSQLSIEQMEEGFFVLDRDDIEEARQAISEALEAAASLNAGARP